jgi:hypothetical protein
MAGKNGGQLREKKGASSAVAAGLILRAAGPLLFQECVAMPTTIGKFSIGSTLALLAIVILALFLLAR